MATIVLQVSGMKCGGCETSVRDAANALAGVTAVKASHKAGTVEVEYDEAQADVETIKKTIRDQGFQVA